MITQLSRSRKAEIQSCLPVSNAFDLESGTVDFISEAWLTSKTLDLKFEISDLI